MSRVSIIRKATEKDYLIATLTADQVTDLGIGDHMEIEVTEESRGSKISVSAGAGQLAGIISLKPGSTYELIVSPQCIFNAAPGLVQINFFDITNTANLGVSGTYRSPASTSVVQSQNQTIAWVTPATDITVDIRFTAPVALLGIRALNTMLWINEL